MAGVLFQQAQEHQLQIVGGYAPAACKATAVAAKPAGVAAPPVRRPGKPITPGTGVVGVMVMMMATVSVGVRVVDVVLAHGMPLTMYLKI
ncbi:hypothetical protein D3C73_1270470 [compost metagenome]